MEKIAVSAMSCTANTKDRDDVIWVVVMENVPPLKAAINTIQQSVTTRTGHESHCSLVGPVQGAAFGPSDVGSCINERRHCGLHCGHLNHPGASLKAVRRVSGTRVAIAAVIPYHRPSRLGSENGKADPTNIVRRKDLVVMRQPHHYQPLVKWHQ
ncbi:hypothetical protein [Neorhizobium galegae]|uniref:hypothetical protein n=1 Tax=Neorhizobium galegae TaxID=399 RepID=UPI00155ED991|nr:hypothetical protein [Neorhizobium galegae]